MENYYEHNVNFLSIYHRVMNLIATGITSLANNDP